MACVAVRREGAVARGRRALSLVASAAVRREGAVARGLRRRPTGGRGRSWPAPRGRSLGVRNLFTMRLWLHFLVALLPGYHYNHNIYISAFIPSVHDSGPSVDGP